MSDGNTTSTKPSFVEKFIGFVDILGFTNMVQETEAGRGLPLEEILSATNELGSAEIRNRYRQRGPSICPQSAKIAPDVDFQITQLSDSVLASTEISPSGVISLVDHCWQACFSLLAKGIMWPRINRTRPDFSQRPPVRWFGLPNCG